MRSNVAGQGAVLMPTVRMPAVLMPAVLMPAVILPAVDFCCSAVSFIVAARADWREAAAAIADWNTISALAAAFVAASAAEFAFLLAVILAWFSTSLVLGKYYLCS